MRSFGAFIRNGVVTFTRGAIRGTGLYRAGLEMEHGFIYADGLTDWEVDAQGRLTVALELSLKPFPMNPETSGEMGRRMGKPAFTNREQLRRGSGRWCTALRRRRCGCASGPGGPRA